MRILSGLIGVAWLCIALPQNAEAADKRNCTAEEREQANKQLMAIAGNSGLQNEISRYHAPFGLPAFSFQGNEQILYQGGYIMAHDSDLMTSIWVTYRLTSVDLDQSSGNIRVECPRADPRLKKGAGATTTDYDEPIYDQGHMANDADLKDNLLQQVNSYVMSNMSPQHGCFNRGIWLSMEHLTRRWAEAYSEVYVTSGAIFDRDGQPGRDDDDNALRMQSRNGKARVAVPSHFFKSIARVESGRLQTITFILDHDNDFDGTAWSDVRQKVVDAIVPAKEVELMAGLDLYPALAGDLIKESLTGTEWDFSRAGPNSGGTCNR